jgi:hypothetical protein
MLDKNYRYGSHQRPSSTVNNVSKLDSGGNKQRHVSLKQLCCVHSVRDAIHRAAVKRQKYVGLCQQNLLENITYQDTALNLLQVQPPSVKLMPQSETEV